MPWYALHVASNTESQVCSRLDLAGIDSFYPSFSETSKDGRRTKINKCFPGYVFAQFDMAKHAPVTRIPQIIRILGWVNRPVPIPDAEIAAVRTMTQSPATASLTACPYVAAGQAVVIRRGPLAGLEGFVVYAKPGKARVIVSITMIQRSMSAEFDVRDIEVLPEAAAKAA